MKINILLIILLTSSLFVSNKSFAESNPHILSEAAILMDSKTGQVLFEKNSTEKMYPASLTKIATAIYALENGNLDDSVTVSKNAREVDGTRVYLEEGEVVQLRKLIQGLLINSGNDAGVAIAEHLGGSVETFSKNLNVYLKKLGLKDTHFENPHGLFHAKHVTSAKDLAILTQYAMENEDFREIFGTKELEWKGQSWDTTLFTHHKLMREQPYDGITGGKNGYVHQSGQTLITTAEKNGLDLIVVILKASTQQMIYGDTIELLNFGFDHYKTSSIPKGKFSFGDKQFLLSEDFYFTHSIEENFTTRMNENGILEVINENQEVIASVRLKLENEPQKSSKLTSNDIVAEKRLDIGKYFNKYLLISFIFIALIIWGKFRNGKKRKYKRRYTRVG